MVKAKRVTKGSLRTALVAGMKAGTGRKDLKFEHAAEVAAKKQRTVPIQERAGFPVKLAAGAVHPKDWKTFMGVKIEVDFARASWLPDDWGQGIKPTQRNGRSQKGGGGTLTCLVAPDGKSYYHKPAAEAYAGRPFTQEDGFNGQIRLARQRAVQQIQLARARTKGASRGKGPQLIGTARDSVFFKLLSPAERRCLPSKDEFLFCVVSARRAKSLEGVKDIWGVQAQLVEAGVTPTWYVDEDSLQDYRALDLHAVVGGKLTEARNRALCDARKQGKVCVQLSDDISAWEYRHGPNAEERTDEAMNAAHAAARRYLVSPVAAARFIVPKMRSCEGPTPKLGGVYMLGSCARTFRGPSVVRNHFILGDFFVVEPSSKVNFDPQMKLKEDYDFTCAHIHAHGSVLRCQRMTLDVKHYANGGGAVSNRDSKGEEETRNIGILHSKWPAVFAANPKRRNEVIMRWKFRSAEGKDGQKERAEEGEEDDADAMEVSSKVSSKPPTLRCVKRTIVKEGNGAARTRKRLKPIA